MLRSRVFIRRTCNWPVHVHKDYMSRPPLRSLLPLLLFNISFIPCGAKGSKSLGKATTVARKALPSPTSVWLFFYLSWCRGELLILPKQPGTFPFSSSIFSCENDMASVFRTFSPVRPPCQETKHTAMPGSSLDPTQDTAMRNTSQCES